jgi:hypothetical protein
MPFKLSVFSGLLIAYVMYATLKGSLGKYLKVLGLVK